MEANLVLRSITLRGIGSYLHGARLDIKPLTVLCGTNGSGKSTWLNALRLLKDSLRMSPRFPFEFVKTDYDVSNIEVINAYHHLLDEDDSNPVFGSDDEEAKFGVPCTVGLGFEATRKLIFGEYPEHNVDPINQLQDLLWVGNCPQGTVFEIRIAHPTSWQGEPIRVLRNVIELRINGQSVIKFEDDADRRETYSVMCSKGYHSVLNQVSVGDWLKLGTFNSRTETFVANRSIVDEETGHCILANGVDRIRGLLSGLFDEVFPIGAIRKVHDYGNLDELDGALDAAIATRHVGEQGESAWLLERTFAYNRMAPLHDSAKTSEPAAHEYGESLLEGFVSKWLEQLTGSSLITEACTTLTLSSAWNDSPQAYLESTIPRNEVEDYERNYSGPGALDRILHKTFGLQAQVPGRMSSGFHQVFPFIVQAALMGKNGTLAIENPEVHLHPGLQLRIAEFLVRQALSGKHMLVETHSDLIIRRSLRAILGEEIAQSMTGIYFVRLEGEESHKHGETTEYFNYSVLEPIQIDEQGRVSNWPEGFMDDDVQESQRLMEIMYPPPTENGGDV